MVELGEDYTKLIR